jgi:hypothetical protein
MVAAPSGLGVVALTSPAFPDTGLAGDEAKKWKDSQDFARHFASSTPISIWSDAELFSSARVLEVPDPIFLKSCGHLYGKSRARGAGWD